MIVHADTLRRTFWVRPQGVGLVRSWFAGRSPVEAVAGISLAVERGEFVGFVGPNGAGKSTTLKMLTGILVPTSGQLRVCGVVPAERRTELARRIGVVFGQRTQLWWDLSPAEGFALLRRIYRVSEADHQRRLDALVDRLGLAPLLERPVRQLSLGEKMRCELAAALLHDPELLLLDEPTIGLDVVVRDEVRAFLLELNRAGTTVLLTSHDLDDIERLCRRVVVIDRGQVLHDGDLEALRIRYGRRRIATVHLREPAPDGVLPDGCRLLERHDRRLVVEFDGAAGAVVRALLDRLDVTDLSLSEVGIEEVVKRLYRGDPAG